MISLPTSTRYVSARQATAASISRRFLADAFTQEIIRSKLLAVTSEMGTILARTSMSPIVYEVLDFACGICDASGAVVAQDNGLCLFTGTFQPQVASILEKFPADTMRPGDVYMTNSPYGGGTHNPDIGLIMPIFAEAINCSPSVFRSPTGPRSAARCSARFAGFDRDLPGRTAIPATAPLYRR